MNDFPFLDLAAVLGLILIGGFFAASEIALITVKRHRLNQLVGEGSRAARIAQRLTDDPSRFLATIQIAITFLGFMASAVGALALSDSLAGLVALIPFVEEEIARQVSFVLVTLMIALASIIIGELVPKTLALTFADRFALIVARPIGWLDFVLRPVVWFVASVSNVLVRMLSGRERPQAGYLSTEELKMLVETGSETGGIEEDEKEMIHGVIELAEKQVHEVMVPRIGIRAVEVSDSTDQVLDVIVRGGHSRVPVFDENLDNIVGILYAKDLLPYLKRNGEPAREIEIGKLARPAVYVPESKRVDDLLHEMQAAKRHIAIVVDEYGGTAGLITMEDMVEEIVGEIQDEYDVEEPMVELLERDGQTAYRVDGRVSMDDLRDLFDLPDDEEEDEDAYDTVGGFIVHRAGSIPLPGATVPFRDDVTLSVEVSEPRRVAKVIASRPNPDEQELGVANDDGE
ncbi:MAG TPA: hemolysin family protein [Candidatus Limnocylindria bacterium]|nr:hemolysin family protein [Candidatus Limnocylindria bacterium]